MMRSLIVLLLLTVQSFAQDYPLIPNKGLSPSILCSQRDPDFDQVKNRGLRGEHAHCRRNVSKDRKNQVYLRYGIPLSEKSHYNIDHIIALSIGGSNNIGNLWPEHRCIQQARQRWEYSIHQALVGNRISLQEAVSQIHEVKYNPTIDYDGCSN